MAKKLSLLPLLLATFIFLALSTYTISGLSFIFHLQYFSLIIWLFILALSATLLFSIQQFRAKGMNKTFQIASHAFLIVFVAEVVFSILLLLGDIYRLILSLASIFQSNGFVWSPRNPYWVYFAFFMLIVSVALFAYGIIKGKYAYRVVKHILYFDDLPLNFDGFTITQISDVHAGSFTDAKAVQKGIDMIKAQKSDLFVFTGDLVNNKASEIVPYLNHFSQIKSPFGQFSILGNHDYGDYTTWPSEKAKADNLQQLKNYHKDLGFRLLLDEHIEIIKGTDKMILAGIENWGIGFGERGDLNKALLGTSTNDFKILLSHDPSHWEAQVKNNTNKIQLSLAGHTHGMQFGIEAFGIKWSPVKLRYKHWAGIKTENGRYLNINRGFGFLGFSGRIGIWPEITVIELRKQQA
ncbi:metallophosphoesterase [Pedobacter changchengzhani]|uniref:Metallophosphoesterase n=1 Tax=Pedobacter changchengzhani TaxID=2529274 RepID=A0A4R5MPD5_9SPHI|nr:metallophosphoesterase [Pedobacter changchengzhani]TDG37019.1 metallophosphoesterase [Pedobacter changchengzhani]